MHFILYFYVNVFTLQCLIVLVRKSLSNKSNFYRHSVSVNYYRNNRLGVNQNLQQSCTVIIRAWDIKHLLIFLD
jgi:hypothetical protein